VGDEEAGFGVGDGLRPREHLNRLGGDEASAAAFVEREADFVRGDLQKKERGELTFEGVEAEGVFAEDAD